MKVAYVGGTGGYRGAVYRPGTGWSGTDRRRRFSFRPLAFKKERLVRVCPLTVAHRQRPGLRTRTLIVTMVVAVATVLTVVLSGAARF
jgi:hypothetical protein